MSKTKLLIFTEYFLPAKKGGGPVSSIRNLVELLYNEYEIAIICFNHDMNSSEVLDNIKSDNWNNWEEKANVFYVGNNSLTRNKINRLIQDFNPNTIYLNSIFVPQFIIYPIWMANKINVKVVVAPRGMLQYGAISNKPLKKYIYFTILKFLNIFKSVHWHATDIQESSDIKRLFKNSSISVTNNIPIIPMDKFTFNDYDKIRLVYLSLITEKKNLYFLLKSLSKIKFKIIEFDIYGPIKDKEYWNKCLRIIEKLPPNIIVKYKGEIDTDKVTETIAKYTLFVLPTLGENFGHAIFESFASGVPVLVSDKTPWRDLQDKNIGYDIPLDDKKWISLINSLNLDDLYAMRESSFLFAKEYYNNGNFKEKYLELFSN